MLIDREEQIKRVRYAFDMQDLYLPHEFIAFLEEAKAVDAVEVVRCKDCKCAKPERGYFVCDYQSAAVLPDWYCWNGERKDDDKERT